MNPHRDRIEAIAAAPLGGNVSVVFVYAASRWRFHRWRTINNAHVPVSLSDAPQADDRERPFESQAAAEFFRRQYGALSEA